MNDPHPSGTATAPSPASDAASTHYAPYGHQAGQYGEYTTYIDPSTNAFDAIGQATSAFTADSFFAADSFFGDPPGEGSTGSYEAVQWFADSRTAPGMDSHQTVGSGMHQTADYDPYAAQHHTTFDTGAYDATAWAAGYQQLAGIPAQAGSPDATGQWDAHAWLEAGQSADPTQQWEWGTQTFDTGAYDATQWNSYRSTEHEPQDEQTAATATATATAVFEQVVPEAFDPHATAAFEQLLYEQHTLGQRTVGGGDSQPAPDMSGDLPLLDDQAEATRVPAPRASSRAANRSRRRTPAKRSALLTIAVPSVCVMGVAGIAAATVGVGGDDGKDTTASTSDGTAVKPSAANRTLDSQLDNLSAGASDFANRASRTQERIDLKAQQTAEQKKAAAQAAVKERLRPKFALPVLQKGLSAYFGQAGVNWMSVHTGIDFPVSYGTTVMAATDGTVRTQWNSAYGNMLMVTAKDGTETWYCHLSSYRVTSGATVKAGQPIAFSGNSGNSTGPHLHFEVRPSGGAAIDPLPWLRSHGLNPT